MLTQTAALFLDAYRDLNARKLFWIFLALSGLVVAGFALVDINARGWTILGTEVRSVFNTNIIPRATFFKILFSVYGVGWWLNVFGIVLALVSTASIIPDFVAGGSVDLYLSKPVSRLRLFLTKYVTGLLFVTLQVSVFVLACFLLFGLRVGLWDTRLFLAIPVVGLIFSYLFCVSVLVGLLTASPIAALLLTILLWLTIFGIHLSESGLLMGKIAGQIEAQAYANQFAFLDKQQAQLKERADKGDASTAAAAELDAVDQRRRQFEDKKRASDPSRRNIAAAHSIVHAVKSVLPKTAETSALLQRWLNVAETEADEERLELRDQRRAARAGSAGWLNGFRDRTEVRLDDSQVLREVADVVNTRPVSWVLGTSLAFEAAVLTLAAWIFCRRDY